MVTVDSKSFYKDETKWEQIYKFVLVSNRIRVKANVAPVKLIDENYPGEFSLSQFSKQIMIAKMGVEAQADSYDADMVEIAPDGPSLIVRNIFGKVIPDHTMVYYNRGKEAYDGFWGELRKIVVSSLKEGSPSDAQSVSTSTGMYAFWLRCRDAASNAWGAFTKPRFLTGRAPGPNRARV